MGCTSSRSANVNSNTTTSNTNTSTQRNRTPSESSDLSFLSDFRFIQNELNNHSSIMRSSNTRSHGRRIPSRTSRRSRMLRNNTGINSSRGLLSEYTFGGIDTGNGMVGTAATTINASRISSSISNSNSRDTQELDQLRTDLVTLERIFTSLLGQSLQVSNGPGSLLADAANGPNSLSNSSCPPASPHVIDTLATIKVSHEDLEDDTNKECCICFIEHSVNDAVARLPCGHFYHKHCITEWLNKRCTCPICRWELETEDDLFEIERVERMKSRKFRVKDHELHRLSIEGLQQLAGKTSVKNRDCLIQIIQNLDNVDIITKEKQTKNTIVDGASTDTVIGTTTTMTTSTTAEDMVTEKGPRRAKCASDNDCIIEAVESSTSQCRGETEGI